MIKSQESPKRKLSEEGKVFVYGTLKVGGFFAQRFDKVRLSSVPGTVKANMYSIEGRFPGIVESKDGVVTGELHTYTDIELVIAMMDMIEGYFGADDPNNLYDRVKINVETKDGNVEATAYVFAKGTYGYEQVKDGVWKI